MLTPEAATLKTERINNAFAAIGTTGDTAKPPGKSNLDSVAWELFIAHRLKDAAEKRVKAATKACIAAGIMIDPAVDPRPAGTVEILYASDVVRVALSVAQPRETVDHPGFVAGLLAQRPTLRKLCTVLTANNTKLARAPHSFSTTLVTG